MTNGAPWVISLFASAASGLLGETPAAWEPVAGGKRKSCIVFLDHLKGEAETFRVLSRYAEKTLSAADVLAKVNREALLSLDLFDSLDGLLLSWIAERLRAEELSVLSIADICEKRKVMYFKDAYGAAYDMLFSAVRILGAAGDVPAAGSMADVIGRYTDSDFLLDRAYRMWCLSLDWLSEEAREALQRDLEPLSDLVERVYTHDYIDPVIRKQYVSM